MLPRPSSSESGASPRTRPLDWAQAAGAEDLVRREMLATVRRRRGRIIAATLAGATALVLGAGFWHPAPTAETTPVAIAVRDVSPVVISAPARQILPDGTVVELKAGATITVDFSGRFRRVTLPQGEAHFRVAGNQERPFVVTAHGVEVRAVGTAFSVRLNAATVEVLVTEGTVKVEKPLPSAPPTGDAPTGTLVDAGHRVLVEMSTPGRPAVEAVTSAEIAAELAWRVPRLQFNATSLAEVLPLFNAHGRTPLALADPALGKVKLSGVLRADNVPVLLQILESSYGLKATERGGAIVIYRP